MAICVPIAASLSPRPPEEIGVKENKGNKENRASDARHMAMLLARRDIIDGVKMDLSDGLSIFGVLLSTVETSLGVAGVQAASGEEMVSYVVFLAIFSFCLDL